MLNLYPSSAKKDYQDKNNEGFWVFRSGERLDFGVEVVDAAKTFYQEFYSPIYRIPSMVITDTGRIIVGADYRSTPSDQTAIVPAVAYSDDNGRTWKKQILEKTPTHLNPNYRIMDQTMFYFKGVVHIIAGKWDGTRNNDNWTVTRNDTTWSVNHYYSKDNGETWIKEENFQTKIPDLNGNSWLGGVGNSIITKYGTCIIPVQYAHAQRAVSMSAIYTSDGVNFKRVKFNNTPVSVTGLSETSFAQFVNSSGKVEVIAFSRRDPNTSQNKTGKYIYQSGPDTFDNNWTDYPIFNTKIPARGGSGCQGSAISMVDEKGNLASKVSILVSYANNYFNSTNAYIRDHIVVGAFLYTDPTDNNSRVLRELEKININTAANVNGSYFGGYSILNYNPKCNKLFIVYENMGGIKVKCLNHLIPILKYESVN